VLTCSSADLLLYQAPHPDRNAKRSSSEPCLGIWSNFGINGRGPLFQVLPQPLTSDFLQRHLSHWHASTITVRTTEITQPRAMTGHDDDHQPTFQPWPPTTATPLYIGHWSQRLCNRIFLRSPVPEKLLGSQFSLVAARLAADITSEYLDGLCLTC
jgi:hypothetical protein